MLVGRQRLARFFPPRAGMGIEVADYDNSGVAGLAITSFDLDLLVINGLIDPGIRDARPETGYAQPPHLFLNKGSAGFQDVAGALGGGFADPKVGRGAAFGDFDRDGDLDVLITTNQGPAYLYRNDRSNGHRAIRFRLVGTKSNRDGIGATVRVTSGGETGSRMVKSGSSYLSQSEMPVTFGLGRRDSAERTVLSWPSGRVEEFRNLRAVRTYECVEGKGIRDNGGF